ncbi:hypothetical protein [Planktosalinus lacus]|uniref:Uncharacterized protein n=1 Tax=Planktosalinus lacus TaxID=1526573 RepID=A0A8J2V5H7_9FLAO|nr:hypothetical protein [Planktosalinus lacus]GGD82840.1 hypothetical protein GCM10011312_03770 [Planktosalinus lacus]
MNVTKSLSFKGFLFLIILSHFNLFSQVGIGTVNPDPASVLDVSSDSHGMLIPRMTTVQRDAITSPPEGLNIYNLTTNTTDIFSNGYWKSLAYEKTSNLVFVYSMDDLPEPTGNAITLDATKMYIFSGIVDISPNYIVMNGAGLRGVDPQKDGVMSTVGGAVLRSIDTGIFIQNLAVIPASGSTMAYEFSDATGTKFCNIFSGASVVEVGIPSLGVGSITGFKAVTIVKNYWNVTDGLKVGGNVGKFAATLNFITGISAGAGLEFSSDLVIDDIDLTSNYFVYSGQTGIKVNAGVTVDRARLTTNMFRDVVTPLTGVDSYSPGWSMQQNTNIPDSRAYSYIYFNNNTTSTDLTLVNNFYKIAGATTVINQQRFIAGNNKLTYTGKEPIVGRVTVIIGAKAPSNSVEFSIALAKNGVVIPVPAASMGAATNNQAFQITLNTEVDLVTNDYIEVFLRSNNAGAASLTVSDMQFSVTD